MGKLKRVGIMGGTFDPIHNAHLIIATYAQEQYDLDEVIFMPCGNPPHKNDVTDSEDRLTMVKIATNNNSLFSVSDYEIMKSDISYTLTTIQHFVKNNPNTEYYFIIGEDSIDAIYGWYKPEEILKLCKILVFPRNGNEFDLGYKIDTAMKNLGGEIDLIEAPNIEISSSMIRLRVSSGNSIKYMVPENVEKYIKENKLYVDNNTEVLISKKENIFDVIEYSKISKEIIKSSLYEFLKKAERVCEKGGFFEGRDVNEVAFFWFKEWLFPKLKKRTSIPNRDLYDLNDSKERMDYAYAMQQHFYENNPLNFDFTLEDVQKYIN